jgi:hypothetical protein
LIRLAFIVAALIIIVYSLTGCKPQTCAGLGADCRTIQKAPPAQDAPERHPGGQPRPQPADPRPPVPTTNGGSVVYHITIHCSWKGARWFEVTPIIGEPQATREVRYEDARDPAAAGGEFERSFNVGPGTLVGIICNPMEAPRGQASCWVKSFQTVVDFRNVAGGGVRCTHRTPG